MKKDRISKLIGELIRLSAEYSAEEFESGAKIIKKAANVRRIGKVALTLADIKREVGKPQTKIAKKIVDHGAPIEIRVRESNNLERRFSLLLKTITSNKKRFERTLSVRIFLKELFGHEIGNRKAGRERIVKYAIREFNGLSKFKQYDIYRKLNVISSPISKDFEGYSRIIKRE